MPKRLHVNSEYQILVDNSFMREQTYEFVVPKDSTDIRVQVTDGFTITLRKGQDHVQSSRTDPVNNVGSVTVYDL
jgi:hypothetical protein